MRGAGRGGAPTGERGAKTNREGVASGSATLNFENFYKFNNLTIIICSKANSRTRV